MTFTYSPIPRLSEELDNVFNSIFDRTTRDAARWTPEADIHESDSAYVLEVDLPGLTRDDVKINVENNVLTITGERKPNFTKENSFHAERSFGKFTRSFNLSKLVKTDAIEARYENGVLILTLPKVEEVKPRTIEVKVN
jgi:HSP20 family protein